MNLLSIWKSRNQILEGIANSVFKKEDVEEVSRERMKICESCPSGLYAISGAEACSIPFSHPCCNEAKGGCGCSLYVKTRSLATSCPKDHWTAVLSEAEESKLNEKLGL